MVMEQSQEIEERNERSLGTLIRAITLSQEQFTLIVVCCNYAQLRDRLVQRLRQESPVPIQILTLPESAKTLLRTIQVAISDREHDPESHPQCLFLFGLESLVALDKALIATNIVREELRKQMPFPLVLWANDEVIRKLERLAPDLYSWAGNTIIEFEMATPELLQSLKNHSDRLFSSILDNGDEQFLANWKIPPAPNSLRQSEVQFALNDLRASQYAIEPELQASLDFLLGQDAHSRGEMETAHDYYQRSLDYWLQPPPHHPQPRSAERSRRSPTPHPTPSLPSVPSSLERAACVLFYLGLWWRSYASLQRAAYIHACQHAYDYFRRSLLMFTEENRQDLVARFIIAEAETLQKLERWEELEELTRRSLVLHKLYNDPIRQARDHGFLAEAALARNAWSDAKQQVTLALQILEDAEANVNANLHSDGQPPDPDLELSLDVAHRYHYGWYLLLLARAEKALGNVEAAISHLETARDGSHPQSDPPLFIRILRTLRDYYSEIGNYRLAFRTKQTRRLIEHQYGYRAFVGALRLQAPALQPGTLFPLPPQIDPQALLTQEIAASGRQQDLKRLMNRLSLPKNKLIVIHGPSGVGKSSIVTAGLVPMLQEYWVGDRATLPILLDVYTDWHLALDRKLTLALTDQPPTPNPHTPTPTPPSPLHQLLTRNTLPILIFDQFEEFFFAYDTVQSRRPFYTFLQDCLNLPFVKVILSLREDYLHYLLELQRLTNLDIIDNDILSKEIRYPLGDFTPAEARTVIQSLTEQAQFYLPDDLIDELVRDLAGELGEVRPIELQVVGAQLQAEDIDTLEAYRRQGPKERLVQRSLEDVVKDCGPENAELARLILFLLTNEKNTRPLKTRDDLEADLIDLGLITHAEDLDLVLEVLVGSGLLFLIPEHPEDRYQIVHDYLVSFIRDQYKSGLVEELEREREQRKQAEEKLNIELRQRLQIEQERNIAVQQRLRWSRIAGSMFAVAALVTGGFWWQADTQQKRAVVNEIKAVQASAETLLATNNNLEALVKSTRAVKLLRQTPWADIDTQNQANVTLRQAVYSSKEANRLSEHSDAVVGVSFSPDGQTIASASRDKTVKLWRRDGTLIKTLTGHSDGVWGVSFSPDGQTIASASSDKTVKLWKRDGTLIKTLAGHSDGVYGVSFSPDGQMIASASSDKTVKLWKRDGSLIKTLPGHSDGVYGVSFSPDGQMIASASWDKTVKLWKRDGTLIKTLPGHSDAVIGMSFSPDGQMIASASRDKTVKLWHRDGTLIKTLPGHSDAVYGVSFSPDGQMIASASSDKTVKLWHRDGTLIKTLPGHSDAVIGVSFSPDGQMIASASKDKTVKLWQRDGTLITTLIGHDGAVSAVSFSPDGQTLASASWDQTIMLWNLNLGDPLRWSCTWLHDYLKTNPEVSKSDRTLCDDVEPVTKAP